MENWTIDMYNAGMKGKLVPLFIEEIKKYTGFDGDFPLEYESWPQNLRGPRVVLNNVYMSEKLTAEIRLPEPKSSTGFIDDVFDYLLDLAHELLHYIEIHEIPLNDFQKLLPQKRSLENEVRIYRKAFAITDRFMKRNYHGWYLQKYLDNKKLRHALPHVHVD